MRLQLTGRHVDITPALRTLVETRLGRLERLLKDAAVSAEVILTREKSGCRADIALHARGEKFLHGRGAASVWGPAVGQAIDRLAQQAETVKGKWQARKRRLPSEAGPAPAARPRARRSTVVKGKRRA